MPDQSKNKTCFVIIGFGPKTDFETGRTYDLDKTFENIIKPAFTQLGMTCFRSKEIRHTGNIDIPMYEWIYKADIVVADVSTLNPNALYELGVRHALRPNSTIVISASETKYPFDLNHTVIIKYEHLGKDIGVTEAKRFIKELKATAKAIFENPRNDSPVYTYLPKLIPPRISEDELKSIEEKPNIQPSFSELIRDAENAKNNNEFWVAGQLYKVCLKFEPQNTFLRQRLALVTYKFEKPTPEKALLEAQNILKVLNPSKTTDTETLGLSGGINKRLFEITGKQHYLERGLFFYSKGYYVAKDHYNGINYAFLLTTKATLTQDRIKSISLFTQSQSIRQEVVQICRHLIKQQIFKDRDDKEWVYQSLAQAYLGLQKEAELAKIIQKVNRFSIGNFDLDTFKVHNKKLIDNINHLKKKLRI